MACLVAVDVYMVVEGRDERDGENPKPPNPQGRQETGRKERIPTGEEEVYKRTFGTTLARRPKI